MKIVFSNEELPHIWASLSQYEGKNGNSSFSFIRNIIYSYSTPIARLDDKLKICFISSESFFNTTSAHLNLVIKSIPYRFKNIFIPVIENIEPYKRGVKVFDTENHLKNLRYFIDTAIDFHNKIKRARDHKDYYTDQRNNLIIEFKQYCELFNLYNVPKKYKEIYMFINLNFPKEFNEILENVTDIKTKIKKMKTRRAKQEEKKRIETAFTLQLRWKKGEEIYNDYDHLLPIALRIEKNELQTSQHSNVPLKQAKTMYKLLKAGKTDRLLNHKIGHYLIDKIDDKNITIGCHLIPINEIERVLG